MNSKRFNSKVISGAGAALFIFLASPLLEAEYSTISTDTSTTTATASTTSTTPTTATSSPATSTEPTTTPFGTSTSTTDPIISASLAPTSDTLSAAESFSSTTTPSTEPSSPSTTTDIETDKNGIPKKETTIKGSIIIGKDDKTGKISSLLISGKNTSTIIISAPEGGSISLASTKGGITVYEVKDENGKVVATISVKPPNFNDVIFDDEKQAIAFPEAEITITPAK